MDFDPFAQISSQGAEMAREHDPGADPALLERNLQALALRSPGEAALIRTAPGRRDIAFIETAEGLSAELGGMALASKRRPVSEAGTLAGRIDPEKTACVAAQGFGLGHHCVTLLARMGRRSIVICFEPDASLLRSVLARVDCTELFASRRFFLVCDAEDTTRINAVFGGIEAFVGLGVEIVAHPPSVRRLGGQSERFAANFTDALRTARTHVVTTLANSRTSFRNALMNMDHYTRTAGIGSLAGSCAGKPAIVVSAGPSLKRNLDLLSDPSVRERFVIIAVQTVLKPMLDQGIRPHFVAALDYHEVSKRFYEGLTPEDVRGVRLIAEPKANPAILDAFPGEVLCVCDELLDELLGEDLTRDLGRLAMGATVAHLCHYFARYLGCDPVIFIGQDLGFTDGQYYAPGAAIHQVWSGELSPHRTLEMFEWERIVRMRANLRRKTDIDGRAIYSDEQMSSYLAQFEAAFAKEEAADLTVIDASEGGVRKQHTRVMALREAINAFGAEPIEIPETAPLRCDDAGHEARVERRLGAIIDDCERIAHLSEKSLGLLEKMLKHQNDQAKVNGLIKQVNAIRDRVTGMAAAFRLTEFVNQVGVLNRMRRDRTIEVGADATPIERQRAQIERDIVNVRWTRDAAAAVARQLRQGRAAMLGQIPKQTNELADTGQDERAKRDPAIEVRRHDRVHALVVADPKLGGLGTRRDLGTIMVGGLNILQTTLKRLDRCAQIDEITIATPRPGRIEALIGGMALRKPVNIEPIDAERLASHTRRVGAARMQSSACWRGSLGMLSIYDEQLHPQQAAAVMRDNGIDAAAIVGADWAMVDPGLVDETVDRLRRQQADKRIAFSQAVPGVGTMVVDRGTMESLAEAMDKHNGRHHLATLGTLIGYLPTAPQSDPIVKGMCVQIEPALRDAGVRVVADTLEGVNAMRDAYTNLGGTTDADAAACVRAFGETLGRYGKAGPGIIVLETCTGRLVDGPWGRWKRGGVAPVERAVLSLGDAHRLLGDLRHLRNDTGIVFDGVGDPLMHPEALGLVALAKEDGAASVEIRTDLMREGLTPEQILESGVDILSVDVLAEKPATYASLTGHDRLETLYDRLQSILDATRADPNCGLWLAGRITRCDAVYEEIEAFYDKWIMLTGCAIIDAMPERVTDQRISALPVPGRRLAQLEAGTMRVRCDGVVVDRLGKPIICRGESINAIERGVAGAYQAMRSGVQVGEIEPKAAASEHAA